DAGMNLVNAIRVAASPEARDMGVLVVLNDEIHAAREVTKTSTLRLQTFRTPDFGVLGHADGDGVAARAFIEAGARGIIAAGFAPGFCPTGELDVLTEAARQGIVVVQ